MKSISPAAARHGHAVGTKRLGRSQAQWGGRRRSRSERASASCGVSASVGLATSPRSSTCPPTHTHTFSDDCEKGCTTLGSMRGRIITVHRSTPCVHAKKVRRTSSFEKDSDASSIHRNSNHACLARSADAPAQQHVHSVCPNTDPPACSDYVNQSVRHSLTHGRARFHDLSRLCHAILSLPIDALKP